MNPTRGEGGIEPKTGTVPLDAAQFDRGFARVARPLKKKKRHLNHKPKSSLSASAVKNEINVTPLVDVVLVLLIIFMVVTPMLGRGAQIELPTTLFHDKRQDTGEQIIVSVAYDGKIWVEADEVPEERVADAVREALKERKDDGGYREVHVKGDKRLAYGDVRKVLEIINQAGAPHVALGSDEIKKEQTASAGKVP